jgi:protocatechuate 3,4-dioxygenase beta subunit
MKLRYAPLWLAVLAHPVLAQGPAEDHASCTVQGQVVEEPESKPLRKVKVKLSSLTQSEGATYNATTDSEGKFVISNVKPGSYRLYAEHPGFFFTDVKHRVIRGEILTLSGVADLKDLVLTMQRAGVITGKVLDRDGDPMPWVSVTATHYPSSAGRGQPRGLGRTNDQGEYRMANLQPGRYLISALSTRDDTDESESPERKNNPKNKRPERSYTTYYPGTSDRNQAVPVEIHAGDEIPININMIFGPSFRVGGSIANLSGAADAENDVLLVAKDSSAWQDTYSAPEIKKDGSFEIRGVPPGVYYLAFKSSSETGPQTTLVQTVEVMDSDIENLHLSAVPVSPVQGRLRSEGGQKTDWSSFSVALASDDTDAELWHHFTSPASFGSRVNRDGSFEIPQVPAGSYRVSAWTGEGASRDSFVQSILLGGREVANSAFKVNGGNYALDVVIGTQTAGIDGAVIDAKGQPVAGATVLALPDAARRGRRDLYQLGTADQQCKFKMEGVVPGQYEVVAVEYLDDDYRDPEFLKKYENSSVVLKFEKGEHKTVSLKVALVTGD